MAANLLALVERIRNALEKSGTLSRAELGALTQAGETPSHLDQALRFLHGREAILIDAVDQRGSRRVARRPRLLGHPRREDPCQDRDGLRSPRVARARGPRPHRPRRHRLHVIAHSSRRQRTGDQQRMRNHAGTQAATTDIPSAVARMAMTVGASTCTGMVLNR